MIVFELIIQLLEAILMAFTWSVKAAIALAVIGAIAVGLLAYDTIAHRCIRWEGVDAYGQAICVERKK